MSKGGGEGYAHKYEQCHVDRIVFFLSFTYSHFLVGLLYNSSYYHSTSIKSKTCDLLSTSVLFELSEMNGTSFFFPLSPLPSFNVNFEWTLPTAIFKNG